MKITAVIVARKGSKRVPGKMHRTIGGETLIERKIRQLSGVKGIDEIVVGTDDESIGNMVVASGARFVLRESEFCDEVSRTPNDMVKDMCSKIKCDVVLWAHPTNPFLVSYHYQGAIATYLNGSIMYDSLCCVTEIQDHFWFKNRPMNFDPTLPVHQVARELEPLYRMNGGIFIRPYNEMAQDGKFLGRRPHMYSVDEVTGWDINDEWQMVFASVWVGGIDKIVPKS